MTKDEIFRLIQYDYNEVETFSNLFNLIWDAALESQPKLEQKPAMSAEEVKEIIESYTDSFDTNPDDDLDCIPRYKYQSVINDIINLHSNKCLSQFSVVVPSDNDINTWVRNQGYYGHCTTEYHEGLEEGAKWAISQILKKNG